MDMNEIINFDFSPFFISLKLSMVTVIILFTICFPLALLLVYREFRIKVFIETILMLPMVLPPTVLGFCLLLLLSPNYLPGKFLNNLLGANLAFSFPGIVLASCIFSFPYMLLPLESGLSGLDKRLIESSYTLGKSPFQTLIRVMIPNMKTGIIYAVITVFAHSMGAFGVILMIGGNIPGSTKVASIAIYEGVDEMNYLKAGAFSIILLSISFVVMAIAHIMDNKSRGGKI